MFGIPYRDPKHLGGNDLDPIRGSEHMDKRYLRPLVWILNIWQKVFGVPSRGPKHQEIIIVGLNIWTTNIEDP